MAGQHPSFDADIQQALQVLDRLGTPALRIAPDGHATLNPRWHALAGVSVAAHWSTLLAPDYRTDCAAWLEEARRSDTATLKECQILGPDGRRHWCLLKLAAWHGAASGHWICEAIDLAAPKQREHALQDEVHARVQMLDVSTDCIKLIDRQGRLVHMNKTGRRALGVAPHGPLGMTWMSLLPEDVHPAATAALDDALAGHPIRFQGRFKSSQLGEMRWDNMLTPLRTAEGDVRAVLCVSREVTAEQRAMESLRENEERLAIAARVGGLGIWDYDIRNDVLHCDESWYRIMGRDPSPPIRTIGELRPLIHPEDVEHATEISRTPADLIATDNDYSITFRIVRPNGDVRWVRSLAYVAEDDGRAVRAVGFVADITDAWRGELALRDANRALEEEKTSLARALLEDPLTGISNRRHMDSELARICVHATESRRPVCVGMIDVDRFKQFNDRYGHPAGDAALRKIASALQGVARRADLIARYGGEEFAFVLPGTADPAPVMDKFLAVVADLAITHEDSPTGLLSISCGAVVSLTAAETPLQLLQASDEALYEAKLAGRDRYVVRTGER